MMKKIVIIIFALLYTVFLLAEDGSDLWLRYKTLPDSLANQYRQQIQSLVLNAKSPTGKLVKNELDLAFAGFWGGKVQESKKIVKNSLVIGTMGEKWINQMVSPDTINLCGEEGYLLRSINGKDGRILLIAAKKEVGLLYGTFELIRLMQQGKQISSLDRIEKPSYSRRILNHWDNLDGTVERGYAGRSIWK